MKKKRGQMRLSFGMIFSIILIIAFIAFAFFAIRKFLGIQDAIQIGQFTDNLQADIDKLWRGSQGSQEVEYFLPLKIKSVCFVDKGYENLVFQSKTFIEGKQIEHIDIEKITSKGDFCVENIKGKVKMTIQKDYGEVLVTITD
jgi:hypothetical protein